MRKLELIIIVLTYSLIPRLYSQAPDWNVNGNEFQNSMVAIITVSDECIPSDDQSDIVGAFDISGHIRGVQNTDIDGKAFLTIYSNGSGENIFFRVYDASTDRIYKIYDVVIQFVSDGEIGTPPDPPVIINFDSAPVGVDGGPDQEVWNETSTIMAATGDGHWTLIEGVGGQIIDDTNPFSTFTGILGNTYNLAWTLNDAGDCIGETDEVTVVFVIDEPENNATTCGDGLDNDGDGLTDCNDPECGRPVVTDIAVIDPTPIDCSSTLADGSISITGTGADLFSLDNGISTQETGDFPNLQAGIYEIWMQNNLFNCIEMIEVELENTFDPLDVVGEIELEGPAFVCTGIENIRYGLSTTPSIGHLTWEFDGEGLNINSSGYQASIDIEREFVSGDLITTLTEACGTRADTLKVRLANENSCVLSNCPKVINLTPGILNEPQSANVFRARQHITLEGEIPQTYFEFTGGVSIEIKSGFTHKKGSTMIADIVPCQGENVD